MATVLDADAESIVREIKQCFRGIHRGRITLHEAEVIDDYGSDDERRAVRKQDTEDRWECVPDEHIEQCTSALCHVDAESWRYYIAPYMIWSLRYFRTNDSIVSDFTIYTFDLSEDNPVLNKHSMERYRLLSEQQARCVCRFLRYMAKSGDYADDRVARDALRKYWGKFCPGNGA